MLKKVFATLMLFFIVFSFRLPVVYNSVVMAMILMLAYICFLRVNSRYLNKNYALITISLIYLAFILFVSIFSLASQENDYTRLSSTVSNVFVLLAVTIYSSVFIHSNEVDTHARFNFISEVIYFAFVIQSLIIICAMFSPTLREIVQIFQSPIDSLRSESYEGVRGLSLSGAQFFPLSAAFALAQVPIIRFIIKEKKGETLHWFLFSLIFFAGLTAGRTSIIGSIFAFLYLIFHSGFNSRIILSFLYRSSKFSILLITLALIVPTLFNIKFDILDRFLNFAFEFFYQYSETGDASIQSTQILQRMYWLPDLNTILLGDGLYRNADGTAYMHTDAGYMRNILFFGILGTLFVSFAHVIYSYFILINSDNDKVFTLLMLLLVFLLHYKGDVLLHLVSVQTILFFLMVYPQSFKCSNR